MISSAAAVVVLWVVTQSGAPDAGVPSEISETSIRLAPTDGGQPEAAPTAVDAGTPATPADSTPADGGDPAVTGAGDTATADGGTSELTDAPATTANPQAPAEKTPRRKPKSTKKANLKRPNTITLNALDALLFGHYAGSFERTLIPSVSIVLEAHFFDRTFATSRGTSTTTGFGFGVSGRYFFFGTAPNGLYAGPELTVYNLDVREQSGRADGSTLATGVWAGYNFTLFDLLHIAPGIGGELLFGPVSPAGIQYRWFSPSGSEADAVYVGAAAKFRLNVGVAF